MQITTKYLLIILVLFSFVKLSKAQSENIPADNFVYSFLKKMQVQGVLENYSDIILSLSRKEITAKLDEIKSKENFLSDNEKYLLERYLLKFNQEKYQDILSNFPGSIIDDNPKYLYFYRDSLITFRINPYFELTSIYDTKIKSTGSFFNYGGRLSASYNEWLAFEVKGTNANVFGNRLAISNDKRVPQSFTFNHTGINFFDETEGYIKINKSIFDVEFGRERILWGTGYLNKTVLSDNPQMFDFLKIGIKYKKLSYDFIHGWLVQSAYYRAIDSFLTKEKQSKYIAISRLGYQPINNLSLGISQIIIYGNRPFEAAYLNPFLFWESAQRSLNDLDNSFLTLDSRFKPMDGLELNAGIMFDDLNFDKFSKSQWSNYSNGLIWQSGAYLTSPLMPSNINLKLEYQQIRPYMFSHPGYPDVLSYSNNGYLLGVSQQPNSAMLSLGLEYLITSRLNINFRYDYYLHGSNRYDSTGKLIENVGGNFNEATSFFVSTTANFLDGELETINNFKVDLNYEFLSGYYLSFMYNNNNINFKGENETEGYFLASIKLLFDY
ncbi:MAG TPA: capsule assembly Wzi family protein [Ignavibacteriaceae bacterium]|nr:capsule assembly Wzi family protein [Ignavibacteriaceae bacterium]